jgi:hypothetical protein
MKSRIRRLFRRKLDRARERGMALMITLMVMLLMSALMVGFITAIMADQRSSGVDRDQTQVYSVAHAGMEKLTSDLAALFSRDYSPSGSQINALTAYPPSISGFQYIDPDGSSGYKVQFTADGSGNPMPDDPTTGTTIAAGPYQGFKGLVTHYNIVVTARSGGGSEVRMRRELQTVAVPVFQFGLFSESSLAFHSADDFNFGGRIHTNGNLYLASGSSGTLTLGDKVTAVGEVVRRYLDNGLLSTSLYPGTVNMAKGTGVYRALSASANGGKGEGSVIGDVGSTQNEPTWTNLSVGTYNGYIRNGRTGARRLDLPLVTNGAQPIDLIRRPKVNEDSDKPLIYQQRYFSQASLRILLSDTQADITNLPTIVTANAPVSLEAGGVFNTAQIATSNGASPYLSPNATSLIGGWIKIEMQNTAGVWSDVTNEILGLGIAGKNLSTGTVNQAFTGTSGCLTKEPQGNAILRLQRVKDAPTYTPSSLGTTYQGACGFVSGTDTLGNGMAAVASTNYWPLVLYDTREGMRRDESANGSDIYIGGAMYYIELDTYNLARWFKGQIAGATTGTQAKNDNGGYIVYFSDRRNNHNSGVAGADPAYAASAETGEFGNEDIINPASSAGTSNSTLDIGEDVNADSQLETYGKLATYQGSFTFSGFTAPLNSGATVNDNLRLTGAGSLSTNEQYLRANRPLFFRHALKLTNGTNLRTSGLSGLTIASENPVYVQGNYNSTAGNNASETHIAASIIADAVTLLSNSWNDITSFNSPADHSSAALNPTDTGYRFAAVTGKNISFVQPDNWNPETNFGMDGGAHNLLRLQENWTNNTMYYRGSIVSFYISRQAIGTFKCCNYVYAPPGNRVYNFDSDFLLPTKLPPGTPMFRDVNTLTFRQLLRPNQ